MEYAERSGGVYVNTPVELLYVKLAVPGELTVTERSVKAIPLPLDGGITQFPSPLRNVVASGVPLAPILAIVTAPASIATVLQSL